MNRDGLHNVFGNALGRALGWALIATLGFVRVADAHVHVCLDGQEAPASVHAGDAHLHHAEAHGADAPHHDRDVDFDGGPPAKKFFIDDLPALPNAVLALQPTISANIRPAQLQLQPRHNVRHLLPPSRGPPA